LATGLALTALGGIALRRQGRRNKQQGMRTA
jgi:hypothetical protein